MQKFASFYSLLFLALLVLPFKGTSCSMYKLTKEGKTIIGSNEDQWRTTPHIWFEKGTNSHYSCAFTGSRAIGNNKYAAQSGMNEHGLTFTRLASYHPFQAVNKQKIDQPDLFLMDVLRTCKNVEDVYRLFDQYDRSCYIEDVLIYVEPSGNYLIVEPYELIRGSDPTFVQANFCPSITPEEDRRKQQRYQKGVDFLKKGYSTSPEYCNSLSNEMHVCRERNGDGTLLTSIWDPTDLSVTLYFYHNYDEEVTFDLHKEWEKENHRLQISSLFTPNKEFERLKSYITPFNADWVRIVLALFGLFFLLSAVFFGFTAILKKKNGSRVTRVWISMLLLASFAYMFILDTNIGIFYFDAPYVHYSSTVITLSSYMPYVMLLALIAYFILRKRKAFEVWSKLSRSILNMNVILFIILLPAFYYWGIVF